MPVAQPEIDYKKILGAYMRAVVFEEGVTFVSTVSGDVLTSDEHNALLDVEMEVKADPALRHDWRFICGERR